MKMDHKKAMALVGSAVLAMGMLAGCGSKAEETTAAETAAAETTTAAAAADTKAEETTAAEAKTEAAADLSGSISMVGSTSM